MSGNGPDSPACMVWSLSSIVMKQLWPSAHHATLRNKLLRARAELVVMQVAEGLVQHRHDLNVQEIPHQLAALEIASRPDSGTGAASSVETQTGAQAQTILQYSIL